MADYLRFSADFLDNLRMQTNLVALIEQDGIALKRSGKSLVGLCPFHEESTPSFHVSPGHNTYRCFGCGTYGDAIEWMRQRRHLSFHDAVVHLAQQCGIPMPTPENREQTRQSRKHLAAVYQILKDVARIYARGLDKSPAASKYLFEQRGLTAQTVRTFGLGVVAKGIVALLVEKHRDALLAAGLAVAREDGSVYDHFRHRIMIPIHNASTPVSPRLISKPDFAELNVEFSISENTSLCPNTANCTIPTTTAISISPIHI